MKRLFWIVPLLFLGVKAHANLIIGGGGSGGSGQTFNNISESGSTVTITGTLSVGGASSIISSNTVITVFTSTSTSVISFSTRTISNNFYTMTSDTQTTVQASLSQADNGELVVPLLANSTYTFHMNIIFQTAATTTGLAATYDCPTDSTTTAQVRLHSAADGTAGEWQGTIHNPNEQVIGAGVETASANQFGTMDGWIVTSTAGNWTFKFTTEVNGSTAKVKAGSHVIFAKITS